ncbi:ABC transporter substrate-binding protein [Anaerotruncus rubiinfantis]|nr:ABC transporter substrate-binding protein [Anaerotruncus rubiinfantis]
MKRVTAILLALALMLAMAACGGSDSAPAASGDSAVGGQAAEAETIRIGVVCPLTGESAIFGDVLSQTIMLLAEQKNAEGGLLGKQIEIKVYDNRDDAVETTNAARKAILNDNVVAFIGTDSSASTIALVEVASEYEIPVLTSIATNSKITMTDDGQVRPWAFRACLSDPQSGAILGQYAVKELGHKNIAIIYEIGSDFSIGVMNEFTKNVEAAGGKIVCSEAYNTGDVDYRAVLTRIKNSGDFDALYIAAGYYKQIGLIANQARELGITEPLLTTEGATSNDLFNIAGDAVEGLVFNGTVNTESDKVHALLEDFIEKWEYDPSVNVGPDCYLAHDAFKLMANAIEKAGAADSKKIRDELENTTEIEGLTCTITFDPETHLVYREVPIYKVEDQTLKIQTLFMPEKM